MKDTIIVAVSAGPDSMCLLHKLHLQNHNIIVAHVNYHQRETSTRDEACAFEYAKALNLRFEKKDFNIEVKGNFQATAREFRYQFFKELYDKYHAKALYLGHNQDDDLETYLMQEKSQRKTLYPGIQNESFMMGMHIKRPLLNMSKDAILKYCAKYHVPYEIDESNLKTEYTRNKIRKELSLLDVTKRQELLEQLAQAKKEKESYNQSLQSLSNPFMIESYIKLSEVKRLDSLRYFLGNNGVDTNTFSKAYLLELDRQIHNGKAQIPLQDKTLSISYGEVMLHGDLSFSYTLNHQMPHKTKHYEMRTFGKTIESLNLNESDFPIVIRNTKKEDKIELRYGTKAVRRFLIDRKVPVHNRASWLVVENSMKDIVFVVGIGCDIHHYSNIPSVFMIKL